MANENAPLSIAVVAACPLPLPRGTPIRVLREAEALAGRGHRVHIVTYPMGDGPVDPRLRLHRAAGPRARGTTAPGPSLVKLALLDPALAWELARLLAREPIDLVHAHHFEGLAAALAARGRRDLPVVLDAHTLLASELPSYRLPLPSGLVRGLARALDRWLPARADHVVAVTARIRDRLVDELGLPASAVTVVENGVEVEHFATVPEPRPEPLTRPPRLLFTGNAASYQRLDLLLEAFAQVLAARPDARLVIAADGDLSAVRAMIESLGLGDRVELGPGPGFAELPALLATADLALNPRTGADGMPVKLLNYMAAARPIVSFAGSAPGLVDGQEGLLCADGDVAAFARAVLTLVADRAYAARLGRAARARVERDARWERTGERLETIFRRLVAGRPTARARRSSPARSLGRVS